MKLSDEVRLLRIIEYRGPREWVEATLANSIHGTKKLGNGATITVATLGEFPDILHPELTVKEEN